MKRKENSHALIKQSIKKYLAEVQERKANYARFSKLISIDNNQLSVSPDYYEVARDKILSDFRTLLKRRLINKYELSEPEAEDWLSKRDLTACQICKKKNSTLVLDHCHKTNVPRGLLCYSCNNLLGMAYDSKLTLIKAAYYLAGKEFEIDDD